MRRPSPTQLQIIAIGAAILSTTALHMFTPINRIVLHEIYQRLYYIPIIAAAFLFGLRGGLGAALFASLAYLPHIILHWQHDNYAINQYAEIVIFNVVGIVLGLLGDNSKKARERAERIASELQTAYTELRQTFEQLLRADRLTSLGELSAAVVHEVRNPLGSIKGAVEIMEEGLPPNSSRREFAEIAKREVDRLDRLVREFLLFARPANPSIASADVSEIVRSVSSLIEQRAASQNVHMMVRLDPNLPLITVDVEQIKQVLLNLTINALQVMPGGGDLTLRTTTDGKERIIVEVEDEGGGVDPSISSRIFDPFFTTKEKGIGLGLSVAYKIVMQHGGTLTVKNGTGGAILRLQLPIAVSSEKIRL